MTQQDFVHILADAFQWREGWIDGKPSVNNFNPDNLRFAHQPGATRGDNGFAYFTNFYDGKQAQINQIALWLTRVNTIAEIVNIQAPESDGNDPIKYTNDVLDFLAERNIKMESETPIDQFIDECEVPVILLVINQLYMPDDWSSIQASIVQACGYMKEYTFSCRYSNASLSGDIVQVTQSVPPSTFSGVSAAAASQTIAPYNHGDVLNVILYSGTIMQGSPEPFGGCEYQNVTEPRAQISSVSSVMYNGPLFRDPTARVIFHELIHALFDLLDIPDTLHQYLLNHGGYAENEAVDLLAVFNGAQLNSPQAVATLKAKAETLKQ